LIRDNSNIMWLSVTLPTVWVPMLKSYSPALDVLHHIRYHELVYLSVPGIGHSTVPIKFSVPFSTGRFPCAKFYAKIVGGINLKLQSRLTEWPRIAGKFGRDLTFGRSTSQSQNKLNSPILGHCYTSRAKVIVHSEVIWWVWSLRSRGRYAACSNHWYRVLIFQARFLFLVLFRISYQWLESIKWCPRMQLTQWKLYRSILLQVHTCRHQIRGVARSNSGIHHIKSANIFVLAGWGQSANFKICQIFQLHGNQICRNSITRSHSEFSFNLIVNV
jgi:hypothetical protein